MIMMVVEVARTVRPTTMPMIIQGREWLDVKLVDLGEDGEGLGEMKSRGLSDGLGDILDPVWL